MGRLAAHDVWTHADRRTAVAWHLQHNHYPPVPATLLDTCLDAISLAADGEWDAECALPDGITYKGSGTAPVWAVVEQHHLATFVALCHAEWVIASTTEAHTYWSNEDGWTDLSGATVFADGERPTLRLPDGGEWVPY